MTSQGFDEMSSRLAKLGGSLLGLAMRMRAEYARSASLAGLLAYGAARRSVYLAEGFASMVQESNFDCAAGILRMQLDTALRFQAVFLVTDPDRLAEEVITGQHVRDLRARDGKKMTDAYLVNAAADEFPWVADVYRQASGYVHFSEKHLWSGQSAVKSTVASIVVGINLRSFDDAPEGLYLEALLAYEQAAGLAQTFIERWSATRSAFPKSSA